MIDVEPMIRSGLEWMVPRTSAGPDWANVVERARALNGNGGAATMRRHRSRRPRAQLLVALAVVLGLLAAAPAVSGVGYGRVIDWLSGKPPKPVVDDLSRLDQGAPAGMAQHPIVGKTGLVYQQQTRYGELQIWLTPTKSGGFCESFVFPHATGRSGSIGIGCLPAALRAAIEIGGSGGGSDLGFYSLDGRVDPSIARLELDYVDGEREDVPVQNGFFAVLLDLFRAQRLADHPHELIGFDKNGKQVATADLDGLYKRDFAISNTSMPPVAVADQEHPLISIDLPGGSQATLYESPSRSSGDCDRITAGGSTWSWTCADPAELPAAIRYAVNRVPDGNQVATILYGVAQPGVSLAFQFEDGTSEQVPLTNQRFLVSLPPERWQAGHRLSEILASKAGQVVLRIPMATKGDTFYTSGPDKRAGLPTVQVSNPTNLPIVAQLNLTGSHGEQLQFLVRQETATHWYEVLMVDGKAVVGSDLQWFAGGHDGIIGSGWTPLAPPQFDVPKPLSLFMEDIREPAVAARVVYADGTSKPLEIATPSEPVGGGISGWFVYELSDSERAKHPVRFEALDTSDAVVGTAAIPKGA